MTAIGPRRDRARRTFRWIWPLTILFVGQPLVNGAETRQAETFDFVSAIPHTKAVEALALTDSVLAIADGTRTVHLLDAMHPAAPESIDTITTDVPVTHLLTDGARLLLTLGHGPRASRPGTASLVEIAEIGRPRTARSFPVAELPAPPVDAVWIGDRVLVALGAAGAAVLDASVPHLPTLSAVLETGTEVECVAIAGTVGYLGWLGAEGHSTVAAFDLQDATAPLELDARDVGARVVRLTAANDWIALGSIGAGIGFLEIVDPTEIPTPRFGAGTASVTDLASHVGYVFSSWGSRGGVQVFDTEKGARVTTNVFREDVANAASLAVTARTLAVVENASTVRLARRGTREDPSRSPTDPGGCN